MNPHELVGIRDQDLSDAERAARDQLVSADEEAAADAAFADDLYAMLEADLEGGPTAAEVRGLAETQSWRASRSSKAWVGGLLLAAVALLVVMLPRDAEVRDKGVGDGALSVRLSAVAEGPRGPRKLRSGATVAADERVVFWVEAAGAGELRIVEDGGTVVYPPAGVTWQAQPGEQVPGGDSPQAYRPARTGGHTYTVELCRTQAECVRQDLLLEWSQ